jgi:hypothetical protein
MPISRDNHGFWFWPDAWGTPSLALDSDCLQRCLDEVLARGLKGVFGRRNQFRETDLSCLISLPQLTSVDLAGIDLNDISAIFGLPNLSHFAISGKRPPINFERLASVQHLVVEHHKRDTGFADMPNLKVVNLWRFKAATKEAFEFELPKSLEELGVFWSNVDGLKGFGVCPNVKRLEIARCRNLQSLGNLKRSFPRLEHLVVDACGRLTADEARRALTGHKTIKHVFAGKQLIVSSKS